MVAIVAEATARGASWSPLEPNDEIFVAGGKSEVWE
jgi:hypothetical protein